MQKQFMKKRSMEKQKGMTLISWVVVLVFVGFQFMLAIKILPTFAEDHTIKTIWKELENDAAVVGLAPKRIKKHIMKKMKINNVYDFDMSTVKIKKSKGYYIVTTEYEPRGKIVGPLDFIVSFKHEAKVKAK